MHWDKNRQNGVQQIGVNRKKIILGYYDNITEAASARSAAEKKYNFHPNHGR